ncbi:Lipoprotein OS=Streptomyces tendae OX=1932 GN=GUR47_05425 PE=4 SV=1 [Streptomyces tendae]
MPNGEEPPQGYTRYPEGKVPEHVGDKWDTYWQTHTVDEHGKVVEVPEGG